MSLPNWVLTFSEKNKGWVSFKSFTQMQLGISMANNYYTFFEGELFKHYSENVDRNRFYSGQGLVNDGFANSSLDVVLNDNPGLVKVFNTLNYEGSQSKVDRFINPIDGTLNLDFQPTTTYSDQEYYNLVSKNGWSVEEIITDLEEGNIREFLEKEGKWFNNINRKIDITLDASDSGDFTFQGIGEVSFITINGRAVIYGCTDPLALNYDPSATSDDGSCTYLNCTGFGIDLIVHDDTGTCDNPNNDGTLQWQIGINNFQVGDTWDYNIVNDITGVSVDSQQGTIVSQAPGGLGNGVLIPGCYTIYITHNMVGVGVCSYEHPFCVNCQPATLAIPGCTDPSALNYDSTATIDDGSCVYLPSTPSIHVWDYGPCCQPGQVCGLWVNAYGSVPLNQLYVNSPVWQQNNQALWVALGSPSPGDFNKIGPDGDCVKYLGLVPISTLMVNQSAWGPGSMSVAWVNSWPLDNNLYNNCSCDDNSGGLVDPSSYITPSK